jgi:hypothetical protein
MNPIVRIAAECDKESYFVAAFGAGHIYQMTHAWHDEFAGLVGRLVAK